MYVLIQGSSALPEWLTYLLVGGSLIGYAIGIVTFFDRRRRELKKDVKTDAGGIKTLEVLGWTLAERLALEKRLSTIEAELDSQRELHEVLEKMMAKVLHSPHRPELDRLLEKIDAGRNLTDAEVMFITDWLHEIATDSTVTKGEQTAAYILLALVHAKYKKSMVKGTC